MDAHLVEITAVESELLTKEFLQLQFHQARVPYALGGASSPSLSLFRRAGTT